MNCLTTVKESPSLGVTAHACDPSKEGGNHEFKVSLGCIIRQQQQVTSVGVHECISSTHEVDIGRHEFKISLDGTGDPTLKNKLTNKQSLI